jgi:NAD(P)-dependent dehydrogenase (short-subunit alcohol dehydrogenase family)
MFDPNGSNTTAAAAVAKLGQAAGGLVGRRALVTASTGPVGMRAAGLLAEAGAEVVVTSRKSEGGAAVAEAIRQRFGKTVRPVTMTGASQAAAVLEGVELLLNAGGAGVCLVPRDAWQGRSALRAIADVNAVPPLGVEDVEVADNGNVRNGVTVFGALGVGGLKMKIHKACIARLFERNDLILDAETISEVASSLS